jgi:hypothetical protein
MVKRWPMPEVLTWIAFSDARPSNEWSKFKKQTYKWPVEPPDGLVQHFADLAHHGQLQTSDQELIDAVNAFVRDSRQTAATLLQALQNDISNAASFEKAVNDAINKLSQAIWEGRLTVYAVPDGMPYASREAIDPELFLRNRLSLQLDGRIGILGSGNRLQQTLFMAAAFDSAAVRKLFPARRVSPTVLRTWMEAHAQRHLGQYGKKAKADDLIARCRKETGAKTEEAKAAYQELGPDLRRLRGERDA